MPVRESLNEYEWAALRATPQYVVVAMAKAGASGIFGTIGEMMTAGKAVYEATQHPSELIRELAAEAEVKAANEAMRAEIEQARPEDLALWLRTTALSKVRQSMTILHMRAPEHVDAYAVWLVSIAERVAESSTEGGFLGFGGERVSAGEKAFLAELNAALRP